MELNPQWFNDLSTIGLALAAAFLAALWLSLIFWTFRDIRKRSHDPFLRILAVLIVTVLFIPGIIIYLIIRPGSTLEDEYQSMLEEEALLQTIEEQTRCPGCGRITQADWMICPSCHTRLKKQCHVCKKLMELPWDLCPYCGTLAPGARREDVSAGDILSKLPHNNNDQTKSLLPNKEDVNYKPAKSETVLKTGKSPVSSSGKNEEQKQN